MDAFRMAVCQQCLMQVRQPRRDCASVPAATDDQHTHFVLKQFRMKMVCFHGFILHLFVRQIAEASVCCRPETSQGSCASVLPDWTIVQESLRGESSAERRRWDE